MRDRGMIKWQPFSSDVTNPKVLEELEKRKSRIEMPTLSQDQLNVLNEKITEKCYNRSEIEIKYYKSGYILSKKGVISKIDSVKRTIILNNNFVIHISQILDIS